MATHEQHPPASRLSHKHTSVHTVQRAEKDVKPYEQLFIKCKNDWIHHLAQALAFSLLTGLVSITLLLLSIFGAILRFLDLQTQHSLNRQFEALIPPPLTSPTSQVLINAFDKFSHASAIVVVLTIGFAILFGSFFFSLLEMCFDVIHHLAPRPFLRRHIIAIGMLFLFIVLMLIIIVASTLPTLVLSLFHINPLNYIPSSNPSLPPNTIILRLASIASTLIFSLILFQSIYVLVPFRQISIRTIGHHIRNSWHGTIVATLAMQLWLLLFPIYASNFLSSYIGDIGFALLLLAFFYLFALILLFGAEVNAFFAEGIRIPRSDIITQASQESFRKPDHQQRIPK